MMLDTIAAPRVAPRRARDLAARLVGALSGLAEGRGQLLSHSERPWASITFAGTRHRLCWRFEGEAVEAGERMIDVAPEHEFAIPGQLVAEVSVAEVEHSLLPAPALTVTLEVLMLEEA